MDFDAESYVSKGFLENVQETGTNLAAAGNAGSAVLLYGVCRIGKDLCSTKTKAQPAKTGNLLTPEQLEQIKGLFAALK